jgi:hypothetical protein
MGTEELRLKLAGFADRDITVERSGHVELTERLETAPQPLQVASEPAVPQADIKRKRPDGTKKKNAANLEHAHGPVQAED